MRPNARWALPLRSMRLRVPATAIAVFAISLLVALGLTYELLQQAGRNDVDVVLEREQERFELAVGELLEEEVGQADEAPTPRDALESAVRRYLQLNPSTESYWTIVTFDDGLRLAAQNGPDELEELFEAGRLPTGTLNVRETVSTDAGDVRTSAVPILLADQQLARFQVIAPLEPIRQEAIDATWLLAAAGGVTLLFGGVLLVLSLWRSLSPLEELARTARATELTSLDARVQVPDTGDEVAQLAREFNTMLARLGAASAHQREFMASVSHELRTPITIARGHLELLERLDPGDTAAVTETAAVLRDELGRMGRLVEDLMAIARVDMDDFVRPRAVDLVGWFEELELRVAGLTVAGDTRITPPPPVTVTADPDRLAQAALNLVTNAHVHTPESTIVEVSASVDAGEVAITVADDGPGIPEAIRDEVFAPFVRAGEAPSSTGLGLSVVQAVVDAHGGRISLASDASGTRVTLHLPVAPGGATTAELDERDEPTVPLDQLR